MIKKLPLLSLALIGSILTNCAPSASEVKVVKESYSGVLPEIRSPRTISHGGKTYKAGYSAITSSGLLVEYFRTGESPQNWTSMMALRAVETNTTPEEQTKVMVKILRSKGYPHVAVVNGKTNETFLDFMMPEKGNVEFNIFRYASQPGSSGVKSLQYAELAPKAKLSAAYLKALKERERSLITAGSVPTISR